MWISRDRLHSLIKIEREDAQRQMSDALGPKVEKLSDQMESVYNIVSLIKKLTNRLMFAEDVVVKTIDVGEEEIILIMPGEIAKQVSVRITKEVDA